jgi:hypothetical protein
MGNAGTQRQSSTQVKASRWIVARRILGQPEAGGGRMITDRAYFFPPNIFIIALCINSSDVACLV